MGNKILIFFTAYCLLLSAFCVGSGTQVGEFLLINPSARSAALGEGSSSVGDDLSIAISNPAALATLSSYQASLSHLFWFGGINYEYCGFALRPLGERIGLGGHFIFTGVDEPYVTWEGNPTEESLKASNLCFGLQSAGKLTEWLSLGAGIKLIKLEFGLTPNVITRNTWAVDFGSLFQFGPSNRQLSFSLAWQNLGPGVTFQEVEETLPGIFRLGAAYNHSSLLVAGEYNTNKSRGGSLNSGVEWTFADLFIIRGGYRWWLAEQAGGPTLGLGIYYKFLQFDYAWVLYPHRINTHRLTLGLQF